MKKPSDLDAYAIKQADAVQKIALQEKLELHIQQLSGLVVGASDEKVVLGIGEALNALRGAVNTLKTQNRN